MEENNNFKKLNYYTKLEIFEYLDTNSLKISMEICRE